MYVCDNNNEAKNPTETRRSNVSKANILNIY